MDLGCVQCGLRLEVGIIYNVQIKKKLRTGQMIDFGRTYTKHYLVILKILYRQGLYRKKYSSTKKLCYRTYEL